MSKDAADLLIGAHTSAAGGVHNAILEGQRIGATTVQIFTANQRQWHPKAPDAEAIKLWQETLESCGLRDIMSHGSYLINLGCPDEEKLEKSRRAFRKEIERCSQLGVKYLNFHPGSHLKQGEQECLDRIVESVLGCRDLVEEGGPILLFEAMAGQGSNLGHRFEQLAYMLDGVKNELPAGICIDTCHIFAAGYDIRSAEGWEKVLTDFDRRIGLEYLRALHLNDSKMPLASRRDRHEQLGEGEIGIDCFQFLMRDPRTRELPMYLETPGGPDRWEIEIKMLREFADDE